VVVASGEAVDSVAETRIFGIETTVLSKHKGDYSELGVGICEVYFAVGGGGCTPLVPASMTSTNKWRHQPKELEITVS
jgi:hypothetical protein